MHSETSTRKPFLVAVRPFIPLAATLGLLGITHWLAGCRGWGCAGIGVALACVASFTDRWADWAEKRAAYLDPLCRWVCRCEWRSETQWGMWCFGLSWGGNPEWQCLVLSLGPFELRLLVVWKMEKKDQTEEDGERKEPGDNGH